MPFAFLVPALLAGLAALGIPVLMHLRQRERQKPHAFPSLMFLRRIPVQTSQQRRVTDLPLLLLRLLALALLILAFARPYLAGGASRGTAAGDRTLVVAIDRSLSMGATGQWERARDSVRAVLDRAEPGDRVAILAFDTDVTIEHALSADLVAARAVVDRITPGAAGTRYAPVLRAARELLLDDSVRTGEIVLVSDLQQPGRAALAGLVMPDQFSITTVVVPHDSLANSAIVDLDVQRLPGAERGQAILAARVASRGLTAERPATYTLHLNGRVAATATTRLAREGITTVTFPTVTLPLGQVQALVTGTPDALPADDSFRVVLPDEAAMPVVLVSAADDASRTLHLERALGIGRDPAIRIDRRSISAVTPAVLQGAGAVMLHDVRPTPAIERWVREGGGLVVVAGNRLGTVPEDALLPAAIRPMVQRTGDRGASFGQVSLDHRVFAPFRGAAQTTLSAPRFFRYPRLEPTADAMVLARFDDGLPAVVERGVGAGRVVLVAAPIDVVDGDFPLHGGAYLPFIRSLTLYLGGAAAAPLWRTIGDGWAPAPGLVEPVLRTPDGDLFRPGIQGAGGAMRLDQVGFYSVHTGSATGEPIDRLAVNAPAEESDLTPMLPADLLVGIGRDSITGGRVGPEAPREVEGRQRLWHTLLLAAAVLLLIETVIASRGWRGSADLPSDGSATV